MSLVSGAPALDSSFGGPSLNLKHRRKQAQFAPNTPIGFKKQFCIALIALYKRILFH
jgi:hypothetical protein